MRKVMLILILPLMLALDCPTPYDECVLPCVKDFAYQVVGDTDACNRWDANIANALCEARANKLVEIGLCLSKEETERRRAGHE